MSNTLEIISKYLEKRLEEILIRGKIEIIGISQKI